MMKILFGFVFFILSFANILAQTKEARKIDELVDYFCDDMLARLDVFASQTLNEPNAKGFLIIYEGKYSVSVYNKYGNGKRQLVLPKFGEANVRGQIMRRHLINFRNLSKEKFLFVSGGFREHHTVELWVVPNGANSPKPTPTLENMKYRKGEPIDICAGLG